MTTIVKAGAQYRSLNAQLTAIRDELNDKPWRTIDSFTFTKADWNIQVTYHEDENGDHFARIVYELPYYVLAEIDDNTYGQLCAFRIYP